MKCPKCDGTGFVPTNIFSVNGAIKCDFCDGTGVFITNAVEPMTNEEWFTSLSTEEKAEVILKKTTELRLERKWSERYIEEWLKEKHE